MKILKNLLRSLLRVRLFELLWLLAKYSFYRRRNRNSAGLKVLILDAAMILANRLKVSKVDNSFANENSTIEALLTEISLENHYLVDIGAADGIRQSSTLKLLNEKQWRGSLFEYDSSSFSRLAFLYADRPDISLCKTKVTPDGIGKLFEAFNVPKNFDFLNLDIDSYDLAILRALLKDNFRPGLVSMEINEIFPPNVHFEVLFNPNHFWQGDHFFGCSLRAAFDFLKDNDYVLMTVEFNNAFFVDRSRLKTESSGKEISKVYAEGYLERDNRWMLFPWNRGMEFLESWTFNQVQEHFDEIMNREPGSYILKMVGTQSKENQEKETSSESKSCERIGEY